KLIDEYILLTDYDKDKLTKKEVINCKNELLSNDVELKKTLEKLNSLKCIEGKSTLNTELIKAIVKKYRSNVSYTSTEIKKFDYPGPTAQFKLFNRNVKKQLINVEKRISILSQINEIEDLKNDIADITSDIYSLIERYFLEEVGTDIYSILRLDNDLIIYEKTVYKIHTISDVNSFIREVMDINYDLKSESIFYRGHSNISYELTPSIYRNQWIKYESNLFRELILRHPSEFNNQRYTFEMLTKMQHYDLPTRLLDITSNPLIALYFACSGNTERTAEVFVFKVKNDDIKYYDSDTVSCVSNIVKTPHDLNIKLLPSSKKEFNSSEEIKKLLHEIRNEKPHFKDEIIKADLQKTIFVKPKLNNERIIRQSGAFILFGIEDDKYTCAKASNIYKKRKIHKYIIEGTKKREILVALAKLGITHSHLFPEIDKTSNQLKQDYLNMV
ncbi:MAG: FRG domain-containing protein, partial [Heyndrickxia oleronia]